MSARTCSSCGNVLSPTARFCGVCGTQAPAPPEPTPPAPYASPYQGAPAYPGAPQYAYPAGMYAAAMAPPKNETSATAALVMGLLTWGLLFFGIGVLTWVITAPLAVGLGMAGRRRAEEDPTAASGRGKATAGLAMGMSFLCLVTALETGLVFVQLGAR